MLVSNRRSQFDPQRTFATDRYLASQCSLRMQRLGLPASLGAASIFARTVSWRSTLLSSVQHRRWPTT